MTAASSHVNNRRQEAVGRHRMRRPTALVALAGTLAFVAQIALAQAPTRLTKVELQPQPGDQLEVRLVLDGPAPQPVAFTIDNPARTAPSTCRARRSASNRVASTSRQPVSTRSSRPKPPGARASCSTSTACSPTRRAPTATPST